MLLCAILSAALVANAASPDPSPAPGAATKHRFTPDAVKAARLKRLENQVGLTADQQAKAKPIIDQYVDDRQAAKGDRTKMAALKTKFDSDINAILTPDQQKKLADAQSANTEKLKAARAAKAAAGGVVTYFPPLPVKARSPSPVRLGAKLSPVQTRSP